MRPALSLVTSASYTVTGMCCGYRGFWRFRHHLPVRQSAVSGWTPREHLCLSEHRLHAPASRGCFSVTPAAVPELLPLPKGLITRLVRCREGACLNCPRAAITKHQEAVK